MNPEAWADLIRRHIAPLGLTVACEPGTFVVADAGILVVEVNTFCWNWCTWHAPMPSPTIGADEKGPAIFFADPNVL